MPLHSFTLWCLGARETVKLQFWSYSDCTMYSNLSLTTGFESQKAFQPKLLCCSVYCLCVNVYCTTATGVNPIAVNKYIKYQIKEWIFGRLRFSQRCHIRCKKLPGRWQCVVVKGKMFVILSVQSTYEMVPETASMPQCASTRWLPAAHYLHCSDI
jgi:hypothetical protein